MCIILNRKYKTWIIKGSRFLSQLFFFILFGNITILFGFALGFENLQTANLGIPVPVNQPIAAPYTTTFNLFELIQWEFSHAIFPLLSIGLLLLYGAILGNGYCGWVCPFGFIQELMGWVPVKKKIPSRETNETFGKLKYGLLVISIFVSLWVGYMVLSGEITAANRDISMFGVFVDIFSAPISQSNTLLSLIPTSIIEAPFSGVSGTIWDVLIAFPWFFFRIVLLLIILLISAYISRFWCRYLCPTGALTGLFNKFRIIYLARDPAKCLGKKCHECEDVCPMGVRILDNPWQRIQANDCIMCMKCYNVCDKEALKLRIF
ncbi:MAG: 4Fe-4S binding protein [Candidatus Lokiarchaeota archaeon]|nr:4Fe-4S binding protein [Candidatus Lokiarchaeota archaeon]